MADEKHTNDAYGFDVDEKGAELAAAARKQSVALNIVENPLKVSLRCPREARRRSFCAKIISPLVAQDE